ncbi:MAG: antitoxin [Novosphingobium sp.]
MSRLTIDLTDEQHKSLKAVAALQGKSIRQYSLERLFPAKMDKDQAWEEFAEFMNKRIEAAMAGNISDRSFHEIVDTAFAQKSAS